MDVDQDDEVDESKKVRAGADVHRCTDGIVACS